MLTCQHLQEPISISFKKQGDRDWQPALRRKPEASHGMVVHSRAESASLHVFFLLPFVTAPINYYPKLLGQQISISLENLNCKLHVLRWPPTSHSHTHRARGEFDSTPSLGTALESTGFHSVQSFILSQTSHHTGHKAQGHNEPPHYICRSMNPLGGTSYGKALDAFLWKTKQEP